MRKHLFSLSAVTVVLFGTALGLLASNASGTPEGLEVPLAAPRPRRLQHRLPRPLSHYRPPFPAPPKRPRSRARMPLR
jgi:hypothetical protein